MKQIMEEYGSAVLYVIIGIGIMEMIYKCWIIIGMC